MHVLPQGSLDLESLVQKFQKDDFCSLQPFCHVIPMLFTNFSRPVYHACLISLIEGDKASGASRTQRTQGSPHYSPLLGSEPDRGENPVFENRLQPGAGAH